MKGTLYKKYGFDQAKLKKAYEAKEWHVLSDGTGMEYVYYYEHSDSYTIRANGVSPKGVPYQAGLLDSGHFWFQYCSTGEEIHSRQIELLLNETTKLLYEK